MSKCRVSVLADTRGLSTVEYVILLVLIAVLGVGTWKTFGERIEGALSGANTALDTAGIGTRSGK